MHNRRTMSMYSKPIASRPGMAEGSGPGYQPIDSPRGLECASVSIISTHASESPVQYTRCATTRPLARSTPPRSTVSTSRDIERFSRSGLVATGSSGSENTVQITLRSVCVHCWRAGGTPLAGPPILYTRSYRPQAMLRREVSVQRGRPLWMVPRGPIGCPVSTQRATPTRI